MQYIHSIWSTPSKNNNFNIDVDNNFALKNFHSYLLSALLIKKHGYKIDLYCDKYSHEIYSLIPYNNINVVDYENDGIDSKFWIWGKVKTQSLVKEPYVHVDGDVFLFRDIINNKLLNGEYKCVVQNIENEETIGYNTYTNLYKNSYDFFNDIYIDINFKIDKYNLNAYNCGVVGFSDLKLRDEYLNLVKNVLQKLTQSDVFYNKSKYNGMFLVSEQSLLLYVLKENNIKPYEIIPYQIMARNNDWHSYATNIGYVHMWGYSKYRPWVVDKIKNKIKKFFPEYQYVLEEFDRRYKI